VTRRSWLDLLAALSLAAIVIVALEIVLTFSWILQ